MLQEARNQEGIGLGQELGTIINKRYYKLNQVLVITALL